MVALFVILTFVGFIVADGIVQWVQAKREEADRLTVSQLASSLESVTIPGSIFLSPGHTWLAIDRQGGVQLGADSFAAGAVGRIDEVVFPRLDEEIREGEPVFSLRQGKRALSFLSPVSGVVRALNQDLVTDREAIEKNPYSDGWICRIEPKQLNQSLQRMRIGEEARQWLKAEIARLREFLLMNKSQVSPIGAVAPDGGDLRGGVLESMDDDLWSDFSKSFLSSD